MKTNSPIEGERFGGTCCLHFQGGRVSVIDQQEASRSRSGPWTWRHCACTKHRWTYTRLHGGTYRNTELFHSHYRESLKSKFQWNQLDSFACQLYRRPCHPLISYGMFLSLCLHETGFAVAYGTSCGHKAEAYISGSLLYLGEVSKQLAWSQWPRGLTHELSSPVQMLGSWVRIPI
jgi:hypothetical protein